MRFAIVFGQFSHYPERLSRRLTLHNPVAWLPFSLGQKFEKLDVGVQFLAEF